MWNAFRFTSGDLPFMFFLKVVFLVFVGIVHLFDDVYLDGVKPDDLQMCPAFITHDGVAFVGVRVNVNVGFAIRACSGGHCSFPPTCC